MDHPYVAPPFKFCLKTTDDRPEDQGWKDTVEVGYGWTDLIMKFDQTATAAFPFMYHCHVLEHEDGMMGHPTTTIPPCPGKPLWQPWTPWWPHTRDRTYLSSDVA